MLLQLQNTHQDNINKLLAYAKQINVELSLVDDKQNNYHLPGKPLTHVQLTEIIDHSRNSGMITMQDAHQIIRNSYHED